MICAGVCVCVCVCVAVVSVSYVALLTNFCVSHTCMETYMFAVYISLVSLNINYYTTVVGVHHPGSDQIEF